MKIYFDLPESMAKPIIDKLLFVLIGALVILNFWVVLDYLKKPSPKKESPQPVAVVTTPTPVTPVVTPPSPPVATTTPPVATTAKPVPTPVVTPKPTPAPVVTPKPTPAPVALACGKGGTCKASDIAPHNTRADCWVYMSPVNKAYNITKYVADGEMHPGGDVIVPFCGKNMHAYFVGTEGGHAHTNTALNKTLQAYFIGTFSL